MDSRQATFLMWHDLVFGSKPSRQAIPFKVMRAYLDWERELARATRGIDDELMRLSIPEIKARGRQIYLVEKANAK